MTHSLTLEGKLTMSAIDDYGAIHSRINDRVSKRANRSVSVTVARLTSSGEHVLSALTSRADGSLVRVIVGPAFTRLDNESGKIADALFSALLSLSADDVIAYIAAWRAVFDNAPVMAR